MAQTFMIMSNDLPHKIGTLCLLFNSVDAYFTLKDGTEYDFEVDNSNEKFIGTKTNDGYWVKGIANSKFCLTRIHGHKVEYKHVTRKELELHLSHKL